MTVILDLSDNPLRIVALGVEVVSLSEGKYSNGRRAILADMEYPDGESDSMPVSVNLVGAPDPAPAFYVKDWDQAHQYVLHALLLAGHLEWTHAPTQPSGFVQVKSARLSEVA